MFEAIVREAASRFGLRGHADVLLVQLLEEIFRKSPAGLPGLFENASRRGLSVEAASWIGTRGHPLNINSTQFDNLMGGALATRLATETGLPRQAVASALAFMLPRIVRRATEDGRVPEGVPEAFAALLPARRSPAAAPAPTSRTPSAVPRPAAAPAAAAPSPSGAPAWLWLLLLTPLVLVLAWCGLRSPERAAAPPEPAPAAVAPTPDGNAPPPAAAPTANPRLRVTNDKGKILFSGAVADETTRAAIIQTLTAAFGDSAKGNIAIDVAARPAPWAGKLNAVTEDLKTPGVRLTFDGKQVTIEGSMPQTEIDGLIMRLTTQMGDGLAVDSKATVVEPPPPPERDNVKAAVALEQVKQAGATNGQALVDALNLSVVHFRMGSAELSADSLDILAKAAEAINAAPESTRIEIGGHTDNIGPPPRNLQLSRERANAVRNELIRRGVKAGVLEAKGYGNARPIAPNNTDAGRQTNRRMEFKLLAR